MAITIRLLTTTDFTDGVEQRSRKGSRGAHLLTFQARRGCCSLIEEKGGGETSDKAAMMLLYGMQPYG